MAPILPQSMGGAVKRARPAVGKARKKNAAAAAAQAPAMAPAAMTNGGGHAQVPNGTPAATVAVAEGPPTKLHHNYATTTPE